MDRGENMVDTAILLLMNSLLLILRISPGDSFPKPLSAEEERELSALGAARRHGCAQ